MSQKENIRPILILDDDKALLDVVVEIVESLAYQTVTATRGLEAEMLGQEVEIAAAVLDINLPDISGIEVAKRWQAAGKNVKVLFASADASESERHEAKALSGREVLKKPFKSVLLKEAILALMDKETETRD